MLFFLKILLFISILIFERFIAKETTCAAAYFTTQRTSQGHALSATPDFCNYRIVVLRSVREAAIRTHFDFSSLLLNKGRIARTFFFIIQRTVAEKAIKIF